MDPLRIAVRAAVAYTFLFALLRIAGKRSVHQGTTFDFVLALILGDMVDDALWSEVPIAQFVVATATLVLMKLTLTLYKSRGAGHA